MVDLIELKDAPALGSALSRSAAPPLVPLPRMDRLLAGVLDEVDYGVVLLTENAEVLHLNHRARQLLGDGHALQLLGHQLRPREGRHLAPLHDALRAAACKGLRRLLNLTQDDGPPTLASLVPVADGVAALLLGKTRHHEDLALQCFARQFALTNAETRVLAALGMGVAPADIAQEQGVKLSTVRTQIGSIRAKIGVSSITDLVRRVASLPPMVGALRH